MASWNPPQYGTFLDWRTRPSHDLAQRINITAPKRIIDLGCGPGWATDYLQIMPDVDGIVEWYKSTGLRPYLDRIEDEAQRAEFLDEYRSRLDPFYPTSEEGGVPFPFRRIFIVAGV